MTDAISSYLIQRDDGISDGIAGQVFDSYDAAYAVVERYYADMCCLDDSVGLPWFRGQVDRSHAMTLRLSIDDQPDQIKTPVHGAAKARGH